MWHPCRLTEISRGDALNYLKVCGSVIVLTVVYPVGTDKSVSIEPRMECANEDTNASGFSAALSLEGTVACSPERHQREGSGGLKM